MPLNYGAVVKYHGQRSSHRFIGRIIVDVGYPSALSAEIEANIECKPSPFTQYWIHNIQIRPLWERAQCHQCR